MFKFLCQIGIHNYSHWEHYMYGRKFKRACKRCEKVEIKIENY